MVLSHSGRGRPAGMWFHVLANMLAPSELARRRVRVGLYRAAGIEVRTTKVQPGVQILTPRLELGTDCFVGRGVTIHNDAEVVIGDRAFVAPEVMLMTVTHDVGGPLQRAGVHRAEPIRIGAGAWIGTRAVVLPGVRIGAGVVIAAGSVVTADCEPDGLYAGVPARLVRLLESSEPVQVGPGETERR